MTEERGPSEQVERIRAQGYAEAMRPVQFGGIVIALVAIPTSVGEVRRRRRRAG